MTSFIDEVTVSNNQMLDCAAHCIDTSVNVFETIIWDHINKKCQCYNKDVKTIVVEGNGLVD